jgi:hypothetical protein
MRIAPLQTFVYQNIIMNFAKLDRLVKVVERGIQFAIPTIRKLARVTKTTNHKPLIHHNTPSSNKMRSTSLMASSKESKDKHSLVLPDEPP